MKKNKYILATIAIAVIVLTGCKDDAFYGSELPEGVKTTVGFSGPEESQVVINSFDGSPKLEETTLSIPVKLYAPMNEPVTVKLMQNDVLLETYYKDSRFGFTAFPEGVLKGGSVTIPAGKTEGVVTISLENEGEFANDMEYLGALGMSIEGQSSGVQVFGIQYHFVKALQKRSENVAQLSINGKEIVLTANDPSRNSVFNTEGISFTITTSIAQERKVTLSVQQMPILLKHFYKGDIEGYLPFPEGVLEDILIEIPAGETQVEVIFPFAHTDKIVDEPGYITAVKLKEVSEDKRYVSASKDTYFFVKVKQTTSVSTGNKNFLTELLNKEEIKAYANGTDVLIPAVLDGKNDGDFFEITKSDKGSLELIFETSENVRDLTLHTNIKESGITSFYLAVTKDKGKTWLPRGLITADNIEDNFNIKFLPYSYITGIKILGIKGTGSGLKIYEATPYTYPW